MNQNGGAHHTSPLFIVSSKSLLLKGDTDPTFSIRSRIVALHLNIDDLPCRYSSGLYKDEAVDAIVVCSIELLPTPSHFQDNFLDLIYPKLSPTLR